MVTWNDDDAGAGCELGKRAGYEESLGNSYWVRQYLEWEESTDTLRSEDRRNVTAPRQRPAYAATAAYAQVA